MALLGNVTVSDRTSTTVLHCRVLPHRDNRVQDNNDNCRRERNDCIILVVVLMMFVVSLGYEI